jgi:hypothetical protein
MHTALRVLAAFNGLFQIAVGLLCVSAPIAAASAFQLVDANASTQALARMFGGLLVGSGLLSALVAFDPDRNRDLPALLAVASIVNIAADAAVVAAGQMTFSQLAAGIILQVAVIAAALAHVARRVRASEVARRS